MQAEHKKHEPRATSRQGYSERWPRTGWGPTQMAADADAYGRRWLVQATRRTGRQAELDQDGVWEAASSAARFWDASGGGAGGQPLWAVAAACVSLRLKRQHVEDVEAVGAAVRAAGLAIQAEVLCIADTAASLDAIGTARFPPPSCMASPSCEQVGDAEAAVVRALRFDLHRPSAYRALEGIKGLARLESGVARQLVSTLEASGEVFGLRTLDVAAAAATVARVTCGVGPQADVAAQVGADPEAVETCIAVITASCREVLDPDRALRCLARTADALAALPPS